MAITFIKSGLQTSIQDLGRFGQMHNGISQSGAMDSVAMKMANWLVSKPLDSPVVEITLIGPTIKFNSPMSIAVCGAIFELILNKHTSHKRVIPSNTSITVIKGDILTFGRVQQGARAYLAFSSVIDLPPVLNSFSTHLTAGFGGYMGRAFKNGDQLPFSTGSNVSKREIKSEHTPCYLGNYLLRCVPSVESGEFSEAQQACFFAQTYKVSADSNRMGIRLNGKALIIDKSLQIMSSGLTQGSIQIPASGLPLISSVDGQTIGGYPRIANIITADLPILGQLKAHDKLRFLLISTAQAMEVLEEKNNKLAKVFTA